MDSVSKHMDESLSLKKKRRFFYGMQGKPVSFSKSGISSVSRYPVVKSPLKREIQTHFRGFVRFRLLVRCSVLRNKAKPRDFYERDKISRRMGNLFGRKYDAKTTVLDAVKNGNHDPCQEAICKASNIEEVQLVKDDRENIIDEKNVESSSTSGVRNGDTGKLLDSLSLNPDVADASSLEAYTKLMQSVERRDSKLNALAFKIVLHEKWLSLLRESCPLKNPVKKPINVPREPFLPLKEEEKAEVQRAFSGNNRKKVLVAHKTSNIDIRGEILQCLRPTTWLNDEVINLYLELLKERETRDPQKYLKCHFFNTFFYKKLVSNSGYNYLAVRRWTTQRKLGYGLIDCEMIFVPIHKGVHWTLAVINIKDRKFLYLDSLGGVDPIVLNALAKYLVDEAKDKNGKDIDISSWDMEYVEDFPQQQNGYDCGMFMLKYVDFYSRGLGLHFSQKHMPYFRLRTAKEILRLRAN